MLIYYLAFIFPALFMVCCGPQAESEKEVKEGGGKGGETREAVKNNESTARTSRPAAFRTSPQEKITNSIGMRLRLIPAGSFMMGAVPGDSEADDDEKPQHRVEISKQFYIGVYEVTQAEWEAIMGTTVRQQSDNAGPSGHITGEGSRYPIYYVNCYEAQDFCRKLSKKEGVAYRLPTDAEWEYACRAGTTTKYYWGDSMNGDYAWYHDNSGGTHEVGQKLPNAWGLYDMSGNVWEWCSDWYDEGYYSNSPAKDPVGPSSGDDRVLRGGCWYGFIPGGLRASDPESYGPAVRSDMIGFRVVRDVE